MRPKKMTKVRLIVAKSVIDSLIKDLHELGVMDINTVRHSGFDEGRPLSSFDDVSAQLLKLRSLKTILEKYSDKSPRSSSVVPPVPSSFDVSSLESKVRSLEESINRDSETLRSSQSQLSGVEKLMAFDSVDFTTLNTRTLVYRIGELSFSNASKLKQKILSLSKGVSLALRPSASSTTVLILCPRSEEAALDSILTDVSFSPIALPSNLTTPATLIKDLSLKISGLGKSIDSNLSTLRSISSASLSDVNSKIASLETISDRSSISSRFVSSKYLYVVEGWLVADTLGALSDVLKKYGSSVALEDLPLDPHHDAIPTVLDNPKSSQPFEFITKSYSFPNYSELDPTFTYFLVLPILYGMIVGDVLYGIMSILLSLYIIKNFKKSEMMSAVGRIWLICGIPTVFFGILFDEWLGMTHFHLVEYLSKWTGFELLHSPLYTSLHRVENLPDLLLITIFVAFVHLALAFILGAINEWNHNKKHSLAKVAWLVLEIGIVLLFLTQLKPAYPAIFSFVDSSGFTLVGTIFALVGVISIALLEGLMGIIELPGFAGNVLSYVRIGVIGVVGVILAEIINEYLRPSPEQGLLLIVTIPVFILLHLANCALAMFEALVQGGRLNIVEFRSKFFHGGGKTFMPFAIKRRNI